MLSNNQKVGYLFDSALRYFEPVRCTCCGSANCRVIDRKYLVTRLFECENCHIYFRHPVEKSTQNKEFYQEQYQEVDNITALLPSRAELEEMKKNGFVKGNKNADRYHQLFQQVIPDRKPLAVIDYGCSWGYISWQLKEYGHQVQSYEISQSRAAYGNREMGLHIITEEDQLLPEVDIFFSSHVIEHHPSITSMVNLAKKLLKPGGYFIAVSPNGSNDFRRKNPTGFSQGWGKVHPHYLNAAFYKTIFSDLAYYIGSSPFNFNVIKPLEAKQQIIDELSGDELICIARL
jgi:2-polyprenyl-3-methyl-5-hydroxy-6-metoxy-1,4-benzoquinol methylase